MSTQSYHMHRLEFDFNLPREIQLADHLSFIMLGATLVQMGYQSMDNIDFMDKTTPTYVYLIELLPPCCLNITRSGFCLTRETRIGIH